MSEEQKEGCIILNKSFVGSYVDNFKEGHNAHEIINFIKSDKGTNFVYCNPYGQNVANAKDYDIKYLLVTSEFHNDVFFVDYVFKIKKVLHTQTISKTIIGTENAETKIENAKKEINENLKNDDKIQENSLDEITYGGKRLIDDFFTDDIKVIPVTFVAKSIRKAKETIRIEKDVFDYKYQRNFGYVTEKSKSPKAYEIIKAKLADESLWENFETKEYSQEKNPFKPTFMDLIDMHREEECYTRILFHLFNANQEFIKVFLEKYINSEKLPEKFNDDVKKDFNLEKINWNNVKVKSEYNLKNFEMNSKKGRLDILIQGDNFNIILENKVDSGINYITDEKTKKDQLSRYYEYFSSKENNNDYRKNNFYILLVPTEKRLFIGEELDRIDEENKSQESMKAHYGIIDYGFTYDVFFAEGRKSPLLNISDKEQEKIYLADIKELFRQLSLDKLQSSMLKLNMEQDKNKN